MTKLVLIVAVIVMLGFGLRYGAAFLEDSSDKVVRDVKETCNLFNSRNTQISQEHSLDIGSDPANCDPGAADVEGRAESVRNERCEADIGFDC